MFDICHQRLIKFEKNGMLPFGNSASMWLFFWGGFSCWKMTTY